MKKLIALALVLVCMISLASCASTQGAETVLFNDKTYNKADLSKETLEWLEWYNELNETEQLAISYIPAELNNSNGAISVEEVPVGTE